MQQDFFLLPAYVVAETSRAVLCFLAGRSGVHISSTVIALSSEAVKLTFALAFLSNWILKQPRYKDLSDAGSLRTAWNHALLTGGKVDNGTQIEELHWKEVVPLPLGYAVPACLYLINNLLYLVGVQVTTVSLLHAIIFAKLPFTALLHHFLVKRQKSYQVWLSLLVICAGLAVYAFPSSTQNDTSRFLHSSVSLLGPAIGLTIAVVSGFASVYTELVMKSDVAFWVAQVWLYLWGTIIAAVVGVCWDGKVHQTALHTVLHTSRSVGVSFRELAGYYGLVISATAGVGLITANILRRRDNLVKLVGTSLCVVTILAGQILLFPELRASSLSPTILLGLGLITVGAWLYNFFISQEPPALALSSSSMSLQEDASPLLLQKGNELSIDDEYQSTPSACTAPNTAKVGILLAAWAILAAVVWQVKLHSLPYTSYTDTARFFEPIDIRRSEWGHDIEEADPYCVETWVKKARITPKSYELVQFEKSFPKQSACPVYPIPDGGLLFHIFYFGPHRPFHRVAIEAFLATQRLQDGHRLLYWINETDNTWDETVNFYRTHPDYQQFVTFLHFDPDAEALGTCFEKMPEYNSLQYRERVEMPMESWSDLVRVLLLGKYGGIWLDADTLLLRDMTPYIRMGPSTPAWSTDRHNNNPLVLGPPGTALGSSLMSTACSMPYPSKQLAQVYPDVKPIPWFWLYNDGLFKTCELHTKCGFSRVPLAWTDGWWAVDPSIQEEVRPCLEGWAPGLNPVPAQLHGIFTWHARLNQNPDSCVTDQNKRNAAQLVLKRIRDALDEGLDMGGRDLFPGPGYERS